MGKYIAKRILILIPVLLIVSVLVFGLARAMPGGAAMAYLTAANIPPTQEALQAATIKLGLNKPIVIQYLEWLKGIIQLDFGHSYINNKDVALELFGALRNTLKLALASLFWLILISFPLAIFSALKPNGKFDHLARIFSFLGSSIPAFVLGFIFVMIFSLKLGWFPVAGAQEAKSIVLPSLTLAFGYIATYSRVFRNSLLENINKRYVLYGKARGLNKKDIFKNHVFRNSLIPVVTSLGVSFGGMLAGSVIVENIFSWPGLGSFITGSINNRDFPMIQGYVILMAIIFVFTNLASDIACAALNPRIRLEDE